MNPHEERMVKEQQELDGRLRKLRSFILSSQFCFLSATERELLVRQRKAMESYSEILSLRLALINPPKPLEPMSDRQYLDRLADSLDMFGLSVDAQRLRQVKTL